VKTEQFENEQPRVVSEKRNAQPITENTDSSTSDECNIITEKKVHFSKKGRVGYNKPRC
jgi:hypothetical protein